MKKRGRELQIFEFDETGKEQLLEEMQEAVRQIQLVEEGKLKARPIEDLLDEL